MNSKTEPKAPPAERFSKPREDIDGPTAVFGPAFDAVYELMPAYDEIPEEFKHDLTPFNDIQHEWFFRGISRWPLKPKDGIDQTKALAHLSAIQRSWTPKHEHKSAGVAYLMSLWFEPPR
jgi:hypothetical protein